MPINIIENVDVEDILLWDTYVEYKKGSCDRLYCMADEEAEVWVIDRGITGWREVQKSNLRYKSIPQTNYRIDPKWKKKIHVNNTAVMENESWYYRPCKYPDWITKHIIERNEKK